MAKMHFILAPALLSCTVSANAANTKVAVATEQTNYSGALGKRVENSVETTTDLGNTGFTISVSHGKRDVGNERFKSLRLGGVVYHDWSDKFYTRTTLGASSDKPVFATRELATDFNYKLLPNTVVTIGAKYARYHQGRDVVSWSAGASWYFKRGLATYRLTASEADKSGRGVAHLATVRLKDSKGAGYSQLWAATGSSLQDSDILLGPDKSKFRGLTLQRVQPLKGPVALHVSAGRNWYETAAHDYKGTTGSIGLAISGWPKL